MKENPYLPKLSRCSADFRRAAAYLAVGLDGTEEERLIAQQRNAAIIEKLQEGLSIWNDTENLLSGANIVRKGYVIGQNVYDCLLMYRMGLQGSMKRVTLGYIAFMERIGQYIEKEGQTL